MKLNGGVIGKNISKNSGIFNINEHHLKTATGTFPNPDINWSITQGIYNLPKRPWARMDALTTHGELFITPDGKKMFVISGTNDEVYEFHIAQPWSIQSASKFKTYDFTSYDTNMIGIWFDPTGTYLYLIGYSTDNVYQFSLSENYNLSTASLEGTFDVAGEETTPYSVSLSPDGSKMFITGETGDDVTQYDLSTPFMISTAGNPQTFGPVASATATGHFISPDGTKLYITSNTPDEISQYTLTTPWDVTTAGSKVSIDSLIYDSYGQSIFFNSDGTRMYFMGTQVEIIWEFKLSTPWDITTIYLDGDGYEFPTGGEASGMAIFVKPDGTKVYVVGANTDTIIEYTLSTAWNLNTPTITHILSLAADDTNPTGLYFKDDGTRLFICGTTGDAFHQYDLSVAWDLSTATLTATDIGPLESGAGLDPEGIYYKPDGTTMYYISSSTDLVYQHNLGTPWTLPATSAVATATFSVAGQEITPKALFFKSDGTIMYVIGFTGDDINVYNLSTAWDITTAVFDYSHEPVENFTSSPAGMWFSSDGAILFLVCSTEDEIRKHDLSTPWDVRTCSPAYFQERWAVEGRGGNPYSFCLSDGGNNLYVVFGGGSANSYARQYTLTTPYDITTATYDNKELNIASYEQNARGIQISKDGTLLFITGWDGDDFNKFTLSTPFDLSTATFTEVVDTNVYSAPEDMEFSDDGTTIYVTEKLSYNAPYQINLTAPYDLSNPLHVSSNLGIQSGLQTCGDFKFSTDGTKMYILGTSAAGDTIKQYDLSVPWESTTARYKAEKTWNTGTYDVERFAWKPDGTRLFTTDPITYRVMAWDLGTAWDVTTITTTSSSTWYQHTSQDSNVKGIAFSPTGKEMFLLGQSSAAMWKYTLNTAWNPNTATAPTSYTPTSTVFEGFCFSPDGTSVFVTGRLAPSRIWRWDLPTAWHPPSMGTNPNYQLFTYELVAYGVYNMPISGIQFSNDGSKMYICINADNAANSIREYQLDSPFEIGTSTNFGQYDQPMKLKLPIRLNDVSAITFDRRGKTMLAVTDDDTSIRKYTLETEWNTLKTYPWSAAALDYEYETVYDIKFTNCNCLRFSNNGDFLYTMHQSPDYIVQHKISRN